MPILLECPDRVTIKSFEYEAVKRVRLLGSNDDVAWQLGHDGLTAILPEDGAGQHASVLRIDVAI